MGKTKTVIRRWRTTGELIALFPEIPSDIQGRACSSYMAVGAHGSADYAHVIGLTEPLRWIGKLEQAFLDELARIGYDVDLRFRQTDDMAKARRLSAQQKG